MYFLYYFLLKLWARAYRDREFHSAVNTNNGTESLNKVLKYNYLPWKKKMILSSIITLLVEVFLLESHQKYFFLNYKQSGKYHCYRAEFTLLVIVVSNSPILFYEGGVSIPINQTRKGFKIGKVL